MNNDKLKIVIATKNKGKVKEMVNAFANLPVELISLGDLQRDFPDAVEDGKTFMENSLIKASFYMKKTGLPCLADDSGLEVEALGGAPGVFSARYSGEKATDDSNNAKMLEELKNLGLETSAASYRCALTFVNTDGTSMQVLGSCNGEIKCKAQGNGGFGYDPYFYVGDKSMAQLSLEEKDAISHRGEALRKMAVLLEEYLR